MQTRATIIGLYPASYLLNTRRISRHFLAGDGGGEHAE